jgi:preprotein translocase subunit YajC
MYLLQAGSGAGSMQMILLGMMVLVFWLFFIRPQAKKQKQQKKFIEDLQKGDKVVTIAGIHGVLNRINDDGTISLEINPGSYIKMEKSAISMEMTAQINKPVTPVVTEKK